MSGRWEWWFYILYVGLVCVWEVGVVVLHTVCRSGGSYLCDVSVLKSLACAVSNTKNPDINPYLSPSTAFNNRYQPLL